MSRYRVEIWQDNEWIPYSYHKNRDYADMNFDMKTTAGSECRIVYQGQVVRQ